MVDIIDYSKLGKLAAESIQLTIESSGYLSEIMAFAICVDDDVSSGYLTVFKFEDDISNSMEPRSWEGLPIEGFAPTWAYLAERIEKQWDDEYCDYYESNVEKSFSCLVTAMKNVKNGLFDDQVLAVVCGSDPSNSLKTMQASALKQLNTEALLDSWGSLKI